MKRVVVQIDRLVLRGSAFSDPHGIAAGIQHELGRLLGWSDTARRVASLRDIPRLDAGEVHIRDGASGRQIGTQVAHQIANGIRP